MDKTEALKTYFGYDSFREGQTQLVDRLLSGGDTLGIMPTGAGKSVCYQVPALLTPGVTVVVSPLISLMKDQVSALCSAGVRAAYINSSLTPVQCEKALRNAAEGMYKIIYVAPERLLGRDFSYLCSRIAVPLVAVDEAHCVSQWGQDFRPSYLKIADFIDSFPTRPAVGAFTATATTRVKNDIIDKLRLAEPLCVTTGFDRPNLYFEVLEPDDKDNTLLWLVRRRAERSGIVYCGTRRGVEEVCELLNGRGIPAVRYHAGLTQEERQASQEDFLYDRKRVMVATNAFGMGIDKSNVSYVIHYNMPKNLESYYQEAGRAGRDGAPADCFLLYGYEDVKLNKYLIEHTDPNPELTDEEREKARQADEARLETMKKYCKTRGCLRSFILKYFGQSSGDCGNCGSCAAKRLTALAAANATAVANAAADAAFGAASATVKKEAPQTDYALLRELKTLRSTLAARGKIPAYVVFSDETLLAMCRSKPTSDAEFLAVPGVGKVKAQKYGAIFTSVIRNHK